MKRFLHLTVAIFIFGNIVFAQTTSATPSGEKSLFERQPAQTANQNPVSQTSVQTNLEQEFKQLLQDRYDGKRGDDKAFVERTTAETRILVSEKGDIRRRTKAEVLANLSKPSANGIPAEVKLTQSVEDVSVQLYGDVAVVEYRLDLRMVLNQEPVRKQSRRTEVFNRNAGAWQSVALQETVIPGEIVVAKVDTKIYDDYVGLYQLFKGKIYTVTRSGDKLMLNSSLSGDQELLPENENTFVVKGNQYRVIFVRDDKGQITHLRWREFPGVEYNAIKIK